MVRSRKWSKSSGSTQSAIERTSTVFTDADLLNKELNSCHVGFPNEWVVRVASESTRLNTELSGNQRVLYSKMFHYGFRLPLPSMVFNLQQQFSLNPA